MGLVIGEGAAGRTPDLGFTTPDGTLIFVDAKLRKTHAVTPVTDSRTEPQFKVAP